MLKLLHVDTVSLKLHTHDVYTVGTEGVERADKAWVLTYHGVSLVTKDLCRKLNALLTARYDKNGIVLGANAEFLLLTLCYCFTQRGITLGDAVLKSGGRAVGEYVRGDRGKL